MFKKIAVMVAAVGLMVMGASALADDSCKVYTEGDTTTTSKACYVDTVAKDAMVGFEAEMSSIENVTTYEYGTTVEHADVLSAEAKIGVTTSDKTEVAVGVGAYALRGGIGGSIGTESVGSVGGSVELGIGAHAEVGYCDGHLKLDVGAAFVAGASVQLDINVGGIVDTVADGAKAVGSAIVDGATAVGNAIADGVSTVWKGIRSVWNWF